MPAESQTFANVRVCLPSKVGDLGTDWQEVDWATWATGELDAHSQEHPTDLVFRSDLKEATRLGGILKATNLGGDGCTLAVTTVGAKNDTYRIQFASAADAQALLDSMEASFAKLTASIAPRRAGDSTSKKSNAPAAPASRTAPSAAAGAAASASGSRAATSQDPAAAAAAAAAAATALAADDFEELDTAASTEAQSKLEVSITKKLQSQGSGAPFPLVYTGAQLRRHEKQEEGSSGGKRAAGVVLSGAAVLLDPPDDGSLGKWQFMFFGEDFAQGAEETTMGFLIMPGTTLKTSDASSSVTFSLTGLGPDPTQTPEFTLSFSKAKVAALFARDFRVRHRLMDLALRNMQSQQETMQLRGEIHTLRGKPFIVRVLRWSLIAGFLLSIFCISRLAGHFQEDFGARPFTAYVNAVAEDLKRGASLVYDEVEDSGLQLCNAALGVVSSSQLQGCVDGKGKIKGLQPCVQDLLTRASTWEGFLNR